MNNVGIFILGLLIGWGVEWIIDWLYWRKKQAACAEEIAQLKAQLAQQEKTPTGQESQEETLVSTKADDLTQIKGVGPKIAELLNDAGIHSFMDLARQSPVGLQDLLGDQIERLADEEDLINQARARVGDDFSKIKGIGPVISNLLKGVGIFTFKELGEATADQLRDLLGDQIERLADEEDLIAQARNIAGLD